MTSENSICLIKDFPVSRDFAYVNANDINGSEIPDDIAKSSVLGFLSDYIQELKNTTGYTLALMYKSNTDCCIYVFPGFPEKLCSILPKPFLRIQSKEEVPSADDVVDKIKLEAQLDLTKMVAKSEAGQWIKLFSHASIGSKADVTLGWDGPPSIPIKPKDTSTRIDYECFIHSLFDKDSSKDLTIVVGNGAEIRCHRVVFEAHSDVLSAMISPNNGMKEGRNGRIELLENSEEGLSHLIRYLYGMELRIDDLSCDVAIELFKTAHKYKLTELLKWFGGVLLQKGSDWFTPDDLLELYFHVKILAEFKTIEEHLLSTMLSSLKEIRSCERLQELKRADPDAVFELMSVLFDLLALQK